jgi:hypothetical protein
MWFQNELSSLAEVSLYNVIDHCFEIWKLLRGSVISAIASETNTFSSGVEIYVLRNPDFQYPGLKRNLGKTVWLAVSRRSSLPIRLLNKIFSHLLRNLKARYRFHKISSLYPTLTQMNLVCNLQPISNAHFNLLFQLFLGLPSVFLPSDVPSKLLITLLISCLCQIVYCTTLLGITLVIRGPSTDKVLHLTLVVRSFVSPFSPDTTPA